MGTHSRLSHQMIVSGRDPSQHGIDNRYFILVAPRFARDWEERQAVLTTAANDPTKIKLAFVDNLGDTDL